MPRYHAMVRNMWDCGDNGDTEMPGYCRTPRLRGGVLSDKRDRVGDMHHDMQLEDGSAMARPGNNVAKDTRHIRHISTSFTLETAVLRRKCQVIKCSKDSGPKACMLKRAQFLSASGFSIQREGLPVYKRPKILSILVNLREIIYLTIYGGGIAMSAPQPSTRPLAVDDSASPSDRDSIKSQGRAASKDGGDLVPLAPAALATRDTIRMEAAMGDAVLRFLRIRKGPKKDEYDLDVVRTTPLGRGCYCVAGRG